MSKLLFITQKIHEDDDDLAFVILWIKEFIRQGVDVEVMCLEKGSFDNSFPVHSLGKESGVGIIGRVLKFFRLIFTLKYDSVFIHMNPEYVTLGGWYWFLVRTPIYLWYTHYTMHIHLWLASKLCKKLFAATSQSMPQLSGSGKRIILGHGIDMDFWEENAPSTNKSKVTELVSIHRLSRSKRLELVIKALSLCPQNYTLSVYGRAVDPDYLKELQELVRGLGLEGRVYFQGPVPMSQLKTIYPQYRLMLNMASETIDKTMLESMVFGVYPVTTPRNSQAIGLLVYPKDETPEEISKFILSEEWSLYNTSELREIVKKRHSLTVLIKKINEHINH
jgi:glycosyltransferase involved in cell wall biosynthesis